MKAYRILLGVSLFLSLCASRGQAQEYLGAWEEGYMDIHHIATGQGDCIFAVLPDSTTLLMDAGDNGLPDGSRHWYRRVPDASMPTGGWICRYIRHFSPNPSEIDYALLTHFHGDHLGTPGGAVPGPHGYALSGLTYVGDSIRFKTLLDRDYPSYDFPSRENILRECPFFGEYRKFVDYQRANGMDMQKFVPGRGDQIVLRHKPGKYRGKFGIRNLVGNARVWTGRGDEVMTMYQGDSTLFDENQPSCGIRISYGKFTYYNCGDIPGLNFSRYKCKERDFESYVADVCGRITVMKCDHHAATDVMNEKLLRASRPEAFIIMAGHREHPYPPTLERMLDRSIWPDDRDFYITTDSSREDLGETMWSVFKPYGHIVVRVYPGGRKYRIFVLDVFSGDYRVKYASPLHKL